MREFARTETMLEKCHYCGCKNKLYTDIIDKKGIIIGHTLRCCNCGRIVTFIYPEFTQKTIINYIENKYIAGSQKCIQESYCPHKNCSLYGTCSPKKPNDENNEGCNCTDCGDNCNCQPSCDFSNQTELTVKAINEPRFL